MNPPIITSGKSVRKMVVSKKAWRCASSLAEKHTGQACATPAMVTNAADAAAIM